MNEAIKNLTPGIQTDHHLFLMPPSHATRMFLLAYLKHVGS
jgi:hypothetical protein